MASIEVRWVDNSANDEQGFHVYRSVDGADELLLGDVGSDTIIFTDSDVKPGLYKYSVSAFNAAGESVRVSSNEVTVPVTNMPAPPSDVTAVLIP